MRSGDNDHQEPEAGRFHLFLVGRSAAAGAGSAISDRRPGAGGFRGSSNAVAGGIGPVSAARSSNSAGSTWFGGWGPNFFAVSEHAEHTWTTTLTVRDALRAFHEQLTGPSMLWINQGINQMNAASGIR